MKNVIRAVDWDLTSSQMHDKGFALIKDLLASEQCRSLIRLYDHPGLFRKTVIMERHRYGLGEYRYFDYPLPELVPNHQGVRVSIPGSDSQPVDENSKDGYSVS